MILLNQKRGLSGVIVTLILILLVLVAVGVVWVVVQNILESGTEKISLSQLTISMDVESVRVEDNGDVKVTVHRNAGEGDLTGVNLLISDGMNQEVIEKTGSIDELGTKTYTITQSELGSIGFVKSVSVAPLLNINDQTRTSDPIDSLEINSIGLNDLTEDYGLISWWRLDKENAEDLRGNNNGELKNGVDCSIEGKFGAGMCRFDGNDDLIEVSHDDSLNSAMGKTETFGISAWIYPTSWVNYGAINKASQGCWYDSTNALWTYSGGFRCVMGHGGPEGCNPSGGGISITHKPELNNWYHVVCTADGENMKMYVDGKEVGSASISGITVMRHDNTAPITIGRRCSSCGGAISGDVDEVMIFSDELTKNQVSSLYKLNL